MSKNEFSNLKDLLKKAKEPKKIEDTPKDTPATPISPPKKKRSTPKPTPTKSFEIPDFNALIQYCKNHQEDDVECLKIFRHGAPELLLKKRRGGGGWAGPIYNILSVVQKMKKEHDQEEL